MLRTFSFLFVLYVESYSFPQLINTTLGCFKDEKFYQEGSQFQPTPCEHCFCHGGRIDCTVEDCYIVLCVDPVSNPYKCCPDCQNGRNCFAGNTIIPAEQDVHIDNHTICRCPDKVDIKMTSLQANCYKTVDSAPVQKIIGK